MRLLNDQMSKQISAGCASDDCTTTTLSFIESCSIDAMNDFVTVFKEVVADVKAAEADVPAIKAALTAALQAIKAIK